MKTRNKSLVTLSTPRTPTLNSFYKIPCVPWILIPGGNWVFRELWLMLIARKITPDYIVFQVPDLREALCAGAPTSDWRIISEVILVSPAISLLAEAASTQLTRTSTTLTSTTSITGDQSTENLSSKLWQLVLNSIDKWQSQWQYQRLFQTLFPWQYLGELLQYTLLFIN